MKSIYEMDAAERSEVMKMRIWSIAAIFFIFLGYCNGITDELTPKQRCYKKRFEMSRNFPFGTDCKAYMGFKVLRDSLPSQKKTADGEKLLNLILLGCLYEIQSRIDCEKLGY